MGVALYGSNGHQVVGPLATSSRAHCRGVCGIAPRVLAPLLELDPVLRQTDSLEELLDLPGIDLVVLCSPRRVDQVDDALLCMAAGKHVYAEKPCALDEAGLNSLIDGAARHGVVFREMAGTAFEEPYITMREIVQAGGIGRLVQVIVQKSYPYHDRRPGDEAVDGGLLRQVGVHAMRYIEHVGGEKVTEIKAMQTCFGCPAGRNDLVMAASWICKLENGGVASASANYLNPSGFGLWGNEMLRLFGTEGMLEATDGGQRTRWIRGGEDHGAISLRKERPGYFEMLVRHILDGEPMPLTLEEELHPVRMIIRGRECPLG